MWSPKTIWQILREPKGHPQPIIPQPRGFGDTFHNFCERVNLGSRVRAHFAKLRTPEGGRVTCGCAERQQALNELCPYKPAKGQPFLTVGMPHFKDWEGAWATIQSTLGEAEAGGFLDMIEILVVDQSPDSPHAEKLKGFLASRGIRSKYVPMPTPAGTCPAKNAVFQHATGEWVVLLDCHAAWKVGSLVKLFRWMVAHRFDGNLYGGVMELGIGYQWHRQQHAIAARLEAKGKLTDKARAKFPSISDGGIAGVRALVAQAKTAGKRGEAIVDHVLGTDRGYHSHLCRRWSGNMLGQWATDKRAERDDAPAFEIDNLAGWFLICRRDAWLRVQPYHPLMKGFGGEEGVNARAFRLRGRKAFVLPLARASHRFGRADSQGYSNTQEDRVRNYALAFHGLGDQAEFDRMRDYFAQTEKPADDPAFVPLPPGRADTIIAGAIGAHTVMLNEMRTRNLEAHYHRAATTTSDFNEHVPTLRRLAAECQHVTEFGTRHGTSSVAILAAQPEVFVTVDLQCQSCSVGFMEGIKGETNLRLVEHDTATVEIDETDLLFLDTKHTRAHVLKELRNADKVRKYLVFHDVTAPFGEIGEDGTAGVLPAIREFVADHPEWKVTEFHPNNHGLAVLTRDAAAECEWPKVSA